MKHVIAILLAFAGMAWGADKSPLVLDASNRPTPILAGDLLRLPVAGPFYGTIQPASGASYTHTLPAVTGTLAALNLAQTFTAQQQVQTASAFIHRQASTQDGMAIQGRAGGTGDWSITHVPTTLSASRTITWPDATGIPAISAAALTSGGLALTTTGGLLTYNAKYTYSGDNLNLGDYSASMTIRINTLDANAGTLSFATSTNSAIRWSMGKSGSPHNFQIAAYDSAGSVIDIPLLITNAASGDFGVFRPLHVNLSTRDAIVNVGNSFTQAKFDSQGTAWSSRTLGGGLIFNQGGADRPEISWYRSTRTYPEFSIREHTTNDTGGEIWAGPGTVAPTKLLAFSSTQVANFSTTDATSTTTGSQTTLGGISWGAAKSAYGGLLNLASNLTLSVAGAGLYIKEGTNATSGVATLSAGTVVVSTTKVTANSRIQLTTQALGTVAVPMAVAVTARTAATSFTITSADVTDTSTVAWLICEPAP